ncbi:MAG TPA: replicative DNA helicase [Streptosporangiaceae bacterium]|nr:replicative DNA helicase [Streptosporangiaceae bacterium]
MVPRGEEFERTPPHDLAAEQCVLGGMLMSKDAISDVLEVIRPADHYRPAHQLVHEVILDLYSRGEPADAVTVANELTKRGEIARVGGAPYLHTLIASVPTAANAGYYARIVRERAILRRLVEVGTRIVQLGYSGDGDADEIVDRAEAEVYGVTDRRVSEDYRSLSEIMPGALNEIEAIGSRGGMLTGVPTGFADLDALTNGLHPGQMIVIAARPALGKAVELSTTLPTPSGWTTMGEVQVGDWLLGADGRPTRVVAATDVMEGRPCYEVEFDDGTVIVADAQHQWRTDTRAAKRQRAETHTSWYWPDSSRRRLLSAWKSALSEPDRPVTARDILADTGPEFRAIMHTAGRDVGLAPERILVEAAGAQRSYRWHAPAYASRHSLLTRMVQMAERPKNAAITAVHDPIVTTEQIAASLRVGSDVRPNHSVATVRPLCLPDADLPLPSYVLGVWLGDGSSSCAQFTSADPEIAMLVEGQGLEAPKLKSRLQYALRLPRTRLPAAPKTCPVCGNRFTPAIPETVTCGWACGPKAFAAGHRRQRPACARCGRPFSGSTSGAGMCQACLRKHGSVTAILRGLGVLGSKHIPARYLRASEPQRRALLAGLLDTDGTVGRTGSVQFTVTSRRLAEDFRELVHSLGYRCGWSQKPVPGRTPDSSVAYTITFTTSDDVFWLERKRVMHKERRPQRTTPRTRQRLITAVRAVPSVPVRCVQVDNSDQMYLVGRAMIPTHNSTLALDLARAASVKAGLTSVIFSLEMSRNEITMRLLSAEARVPLHSMRTGQMSEDDWARLARRMSEVVDAPMFIDDSPNMSMMEIRAKCRRLKQRHDLRLVIIDYLQLMSSPKRVENRQQEVSDMSRSLKLLAKELDVPVVAVAQLNRGPEQRTDKRPLLADLRESGCLTEDTTLLRADTGAPVTMRALMDDDHQGVLVWSIDDQQHIVPAPIANVFASGVKEVFRLSLASGREVKASGNHPFLTFAGWVPLERLAAGDRIGVPRRVPEPVGPALGWTEYRLGLLAHLIGSGCVLRSQPVHYTSNDETNLAFVEHAAAAEFGITPRRVQQNTWWHTYLPAPYHCTHGRDNPLHVWFRELGIGDLRSHQKRIPEIVYSANNREIAVFLGHLWATDGCVAVPRSKTAPKTYYASSSRDLADGVAALLARLGIVARIRCVEEPGYKPNFHVVIADGPSLQTFCSEIGVHGRRGEIVTEMLRFLDSRAVNTNADTLPLEVWDLVKAERIRAGLSERRFQAAIGTHYCGSTLYKACPSRERLLRCAVALDSPALRAVATSDIYWDRIVSVESLGPRPVFDATVKETHNFIANGIYAHNSIEQDSDVVILLHREDAYERESPRAGEADFIVAKHRNGPTATVTVAFQGHYSRFTDMARI